MRDSTLCIDLLPHIPSCNARDSVCMPTSICDKNGVRTYRVSPSSSTSYHHSRYVTRSALQACWPSGTFIQAAAMNTLPNLRNRAPWTVESARGLRDRSCEARSRRILRVWSTPECDQTHSCVASRNVLPMPPIVHTRWPPDLEGRGRWHCRCSGFGRTTDREPWT